MDTSAMHAEYMGQSVSCPYETGFETFDFITLKLCYSMDTMAYVCSLLCCKQNFRKTKPIVLDPPKSLSSFIESIDKM